MGFPPNHRQCVFPSDAEGMNQGTEARLPDGSGAMFRQPNAVRICQDKAPIPDSIPLEVIGYFLMALLPGCHSLK